MKRNCLLIFAILLSSILIYNGTKRIMALKTTSQEVIEAEKRLEKLKSENEVLKKDLEYKKSNEFVEGEIRNKLGLAKQGEAIVVVPREENVSGSDLAVKQIPNWKKWRILFFGS